MIHLIYQHYKTIPIMSITFQLRSLDITPSNIDDRWFQNLLNTCHIIEFHPIVEINAIKYFLVIKQQFPLFHEINFVKVEKKGKF